jgi:hypothetical protein
MGGNEKGGGMEEDNINVNDDEENELMSYIAK